MQTNTSGTITRQDFQALELPPQKRRLCSAWRSGQQTAKRICNVTPSSVQAAGPEPFFYIKTITLLLQECAQQENSPIGLSAFLSPIKQGISCGRFYETRYLRQAALRINSRPARLPHTPSQSAYHKFIQHVP